MDSGMQAGPGSVGALPGGGALVLHVAGRLLHDHGLAGLVAELPLEVHVPSEGALEDRRGGGELFFFNL